MHDRQIVFSCSFVVVPGISYEKNKRSLGDDKALTVFSRIYEAFTGKKIIEANPYSKIFYTGYTSETPEKVSFKQLMRYHDLTPQIQIAVSSYAEMITGTEMQINADDDRAKEMIEEWNRSTGFYDKFEGLVNTILICGAGILEKLDDTKTQDVVEVDMKTITGKKRDEFGNLLYYETTDKNGAPKKLGDTILKRFIEFNLTPYSRQPWGRSLFYSLAVPRTVGERTNMPLVEVLWSIEDAMGAIIINNGYPITTITYEGVTDDWLEKEAEKWRRYKPGDKKVQKRKADIEFFEPSPNSKFTDYITHLEKAIELGTQFPHDILTGDFTSRASSETTENIVLKRVRGYQRYLSNKLKNELYDPILQQNGIDPRKANLTISFTTQNIITLNPDQVLARGMSGFWTKAEVREWDKAQTAVDLFDDDKIQGDVKEPEPIVMKDNPLEQEAIKTYKMVQDEIKKERIEKRAEEIKKKIVKPRDSKKSN